MKFLKIALVLGVAVAIPALGYCGQVARTGMLLDMEGSVHVRLSDGQSVAAEIGMELNQGDIIITGRDSFALVRIDGMETATAELDANSQMLFSEMVMDRGKGTQTTLLDLAIGKVLIRADRIHSDRSKFEVKTPTSVVGVRGTTFTVEVEELD